MTDKREELPCASLSCDRERGHPIRCSECQRFYHVYCWARHENRHDPDCPE